MSVKQEDCGTMPDKRCPLCRKKGHWKCVEVDGERVWQCPTDRYTIAVMTESN